MKEYKIQMRFDSKHEGKWVTATQPWGAVLCYSHTSAVEAQRTIGRAISNWNEPTWKSKEQPVEFRILSREVSEWEPLN